MPSCLAQTNWAWMRYPLDDARMAPMRDEIDRINRLGDDAPGCVWRFETPVGDATDVRVLDDPRILFNLTLWRSLDDLRRYVYQSEHVAFFRRRRDWFIPPPQPPLAPDLGSRPTCGSVVPLSLRGLLPLAMAACRAARPRPRSSPARGGGHALAWARSELGRRD